MPKVSIIVPNYNHARFLRQRLDSILNQTFQDFEVIILDDCSTDDSVNVIKEYASNKHVSHTILNSTNSGSPAKQWIKGIHLAKGEWIWIAESDDFCEPTFLEEMTKLAELKENTGLVVCNSHFTDEHGKEYSSSDSLNDMYTYCTNQSWAVFEKNVFFSKYLNSVNHLYNASSIVFRKEYLIEPELLSRFVISGDWMCWSLVVTKSEYVVYNNNKLNFFRRVPGSITYSSQYTARKESVSILFNQAKIGLCTKISAARMAANWVAKPHPYSSDKTKFKEMDIIFEFDLNTKDKILLAFFSAWLWIRID